MANESYMLKTQLAATGERIYYLASAKHLLIDHKKGSADDNWFTDKFGNINSVLTPIIGVYDTYASLPSASTQTAGAYAIVSEGPYLHRVEETSGTKVWTASNKGVPVDGTRLFINMADGDKLCRLSGTAFRAISGDSNSTRLVVMTETFGESGWQYAITGSTSAPAAAANGRCLIMTTTTSGGTITVTPIWCLAVSDGQGGYVWDTENTVSAADDLTTSNLYYATATGRLYMWVDGNGSLTCIAKPSAGSEGGSSGSIEFEDVPGLSDTTYPSPAEW